MRLIRLAGPLVAIAMTGALATPAQAADADDAIGGWVEGVGTFGGAAVDGASTLAAAPKHTGRSEEKVIDGTSNKRAHGWTTWVGVKHYTRARMIHRGDWFSDTHIFSDSGRKWGVNGTEAVSGWVAYTPDGADGRPGSAETFYGK